MINHPNRSRKFELAFSGGAIASYFPRYRRWHATFDAAVEEAGNVYQKLGDDGYPTACHSAIVYGPGCGADGRTVA